jgi:hypothetical protein
MTFLSFHLGGEIRENAKIYTTFVGTSRIREVQLSAIV